MNNFDLKLIKSVALPEMLETGHDYIVVGRMCVTDINKHDEADGNFTYTHKGQLTHLEIVTKQGKTLKLVAKGSKSQVLRAKILERGDRDYYDKIIDRIILNIDEIIQKYGN